MNKYRCETCTNKREVPKKPNYSDYNPYWYPEYVRCLVDDHIMTGDDYARICSVGCASHSDLQYQCGDECKGECSGEVTGISFCPQNQKELWCGNCGFKESETCNDEITWKRCRLMSSELEGKNVENRLELARSSAIEKVLDKLDKWADLLPPYFGKDMPKNMLKRKIVELRQESKVE